MPKTRRVSSKPGARARGAAHREARQDLSAIESNPKRFHCWAFLSELCHKVALDLAIGGNTVIFDREIHVAEGAPMKSMSIEKLRTV